MWFVWLEQIDSSPTPSQKKALQSIRKTVAAGILAIIWLGWWLTIHDNEDLRSTSVLLFLISGAATVALGVEAYDLKNKKWLPRITSLIGPRHNHRNRAS